MKAIFPNFVPLDDDAAIAEHYAWPDQGTSGRAPWVRVNFVSSVDGGAWGPNRLSNSISSASDRRVFNILRATSDVILAGASTALSENYGPPLSSAKGQALRQDLGIDGAPSLALVSNSGSIPASAKFFDDNSDGPLIFVSDETNVDPEVESLGTVVRTGAREVDLAKVIQNLSERGFKRILCEGGPHLFTSLLDLELVDEICLTVTPTIVGPADVSGPISRIVAGDQVLNSGIELDLKRLAEDDGTLLGIWSVKPTNDASNLLS